MARPSPTALPMKEVRRRLGVALDALRAAVEDVERATAIDDSSMSIGNP